MPGEAGVPSMPNDKPGTSVQCTSRNLRKASPGTLSDPDRPARDEQTVQRHLRIRAPA